MYSYLFFVLNFVLLSIGCTSSEEETSELIPTGNLTPECVERYSRVLVTRLVPPRSYQYHHEVEDSASRDDDGNEFGYRIVGGAAVSIAQVPYQVLYGLYCGGVLVAPEWVLTAAHCKEKETYVYAGSTSRRETTKYRICAHFVHPMWYSKTKLHPHDYDYQLVLLERSVPVTAMSRPVAIASVDEIVPGEMMTISGWGHLGYKTNKMQDTVHRVRIPVMSSAECRAMPDPGYRNITSRMFCAGYANGAKDSCQGDSGGPGVIRGKLAGLVSYGIGCAGVQQPGVYANVPMVRGWIRNVTALPL